MGCTYHVGHEFDGEETMGRCFFSRTEEVPPRGTRCDAYTGVEADGIAMALGMDRAEGDVGATIAILDCDLRIEAISTGVERSWWPRFLRDDFRVELRDETGRKVTPRPMMNSQIKPFWEAMEVALGKAPRAAGRSKLVPFNRVGSLTLGKLGLVVPQNVAQSIEDDDADLEYHSAIAMIRSPGMVVWHHRKGRMGFPPVAGVFLADDDVDAILRCSEPPEHNRRDERAARLGTDGERGVVKAIKERTWRAFREFQTSAQPPSLRAAGGRANSSGC
ncbi:hypothetical protein KTN05_15995 [Paracoccus sp. Z118]|uniref:hypothetical protein n=1 Tax=Paracoccus sp. Z118 TaxID=2851017 RepID=UPI001C2CB74B|nr:hypothetical protein [Paracoccus sp. Z118]MBV0893314.1 hypothetical protein [Paracoccus sp. Z118]